MTEKKNPNPFINLANEAKKKNAIAPAGKKAEQKAEAAEAAGAQGKFWEMQYSNKFVTIFAIVFVVL